MKKSRDIFIYLEDKVISYILAIPVQPFQNRWKKLTVLSGHKISDMQFYSDQRSIISYFPWLITRKERMLMAKQEDAHLIFILIWI